MNKFISIVLLVTIVSASVGNATRLRNFKQSRFSARQELADDIPTQTPYPPSGMKPDIPFELPNEPQPPKPLPPTQPRTPLQPPVLQEPQEPEEPLQPEEPLEPEEPIEPEEPEEPGKPKQPDNTYLPPDSLQPPAQTYGPPDQVYGPPEASGDGGEPSEDDIVEVLPGIQPALPQDNQNELPPVNPEAEVIPNIENGRIVQARNLRRQNIKPAKLRSARLQSQRLVAQPLFATNGDLVAYRFVRV